MRAAVPQFHLSSSAYPYLHHSTRAMTWYAVFDRIYCNFLHDLLTEKHCIRKTCRNVFTALTTADSQHVLISNS